MPRWLNVLSSLLLAFALAGCDPVAEIVAPAEITPATDTPFEARMLPGLEAQEATMEEFLWDFGDGHTASGKTAQHRYAEPGTYEVTLSVVDASTRQWGQAYVSKRTVTVRAPRGAPAPWTASVQPGACEPSAQGRDYQVGTQAGQLPSLNDVPWESLQAGDTVRIFHRAEPWRGKILIAAQGTAEQPVRVCGVKGANGERPVIDGNGATTRTALAPLYGHPLHQSRSVLVIKTLSGQAWQDHPRYIIVDGLEIRGAHPRHTFTDASGAVKPYEAFGACLWIDRGHHIVIADNEIHDCTNGLYAKSTDDGDFAVSTDLRITGNRIHDNGIVGDDHMHDIYTAANGIVFEFNHIGPQRPGAGGNAIKDRSVGTVVRYNRIEEGAHAIDLVEAEDFPETATALPAYRSTWVYGNQIVKSGNTGSVIHYGGDHYGANPGDGWGEPIYRKGVLYFFNNTVQVTGTEFAALFQVSTTEERVEAFNNIISFDPANPYPRLRMGSEVGSGWTSGGIVNLGVNWVSAGWMDSDPWHPVNGALNGTAQLLSGPTLPVDPATLVPLAGSAVVDVAAALPAAAEQHPVLFQLDAAFKAVPRAPRGGRGDLGAVER